MVFSLLEDQENRSWINIEDLLRSLPILLFYTLHVRGLLALTEVQSSFQMHLFLFLLGFFSFFDSHILKLTSVLHSCPTHSLHYSPLLQSRKQFLFLIGCSFTNLMTLSTLPLTAVYSMFHNFVLSIHQLASSCTAL